MVWLEDWAKRIPIEIDQTKIDEDLTDFPVLITVTGTEVFDALTVSGGPDAYDILFIDSKGDQSSGANSLIIGNPTTENNGPTFTTVSGIKCILFDSVNDIIYCPSSTNYDFGTSNFTIEAWIMPLSLASNSYVISYGAVDGAGAINGAWAFGVTQLFDVMVSGTASSDSFYAAGYEASKACDDNTGTRFSSTASAYPHWWKYDFGSGVTKVIRAIRLRQYIDGANGGRAFTFEGSNDNSSWAVLYSGEAPNITSTYVLTVFNNSTAYRYYRINFTTAWQGSTLSIEEIELGESPCRLSFMLRSSSTAYSLFSDGSGTLAINTWNHVAIARNSSTLFFYVNGIQVGSVACNYDFILASPSNISLGYRYSNGYIENFNGYLCKWRLSKGIGRYTSTFTPPTTYVNDSYTKFMYMVEGDISPAENTMLAWSTPGISTTATPFNRYASINCINKNSNDYFYIAHGSHFDLGANDFTFEGWVYLREYAASLGSSIFSKRSSYTLYRYISIAVTTTGYLQFSATNNGTSWDISFTGSFVPLNTWVHFAVVRTGSTFDLYYNGIKTNTGTMTGSIYMDTNGVAIGIGDTNDGLDWYGYLYGLRLSKGIARYSDNFVPGDPLEFNSSFTNRKKIAITDANNNQLYTEIERWDHANKKAWLWTKVPTVASGTNTKLYLYYDKNKADNTNYVGDTASIPATNVWDSNFMAVYHLSSGNPSTAGSIKDATASGNHVSSVAGGMTVANLAPAKIGYGLDFEKDVSQYCNIPLTASLKGRTAASLESIVKIESHGGSNYFYSPYYESTSTSQMYTRFATFVKGIGASSSRMSVYFRDTTTGDSGTPINLDDTLDLSLSTHYYMAATVNTDTDELKLFRDNTRVGLNTSAKTSFSTNTSAVIYIGNAATQYFDGIIEEVRVSKVERSEAWLKATYYSNWNDLLLFGSTEDPPYFFYEGYVNVQGVPSARKVHLHRRSTGQCVDTTTSSGTTGYFKLQSRYPDYHYVIILPELEDNYPLLFDDKIHPEI